MSSFRAGQEGSRLLRGSPPQVAAFGLLAFALMLFGMEFVLRPENTALWWPASGAMVASFLLMPRRVWIYLLPTYFLCSLGANLLFEVPRDTSLGWAVCNMSIGFIAAVVVHRLQGHRRFDLRSPKGLAVFLIGACVLGNAIVGLGGAFVAHETLDSPLLRTWRTWIISDSVGILTVAPVLLLWLPSARSRGGGPTTRSREALATLLLVGGLGTAIFTGFPEGDRVGFLAAVALVLPVVWTGLRHGARWVSLQSLLLTALLTGSAILGWGPLALSGPTRAPRVLEIQLFMLLWAVTGLTVCALSSRLFQALAGERLARERLERAEQASRVGLWEWLPRENRLFASKMVATLVGSEERDSEPPPFDHWTENCHPEDRERLRNALARHVEEARPFRVDCRLGPSSDKARWCHIEADSERDAEGRIIRLSGSLSDIQDQMDLQDRVRQSQKLDALGSLAGGVAHDFNNILGGIQGATEILELRTPKDSPQRKYIALIHTATQRAAALVSRLLTFARRGMTVTSPFDVNDVVRDTVALLEETVGREVQIHALVADSPVVVRGDPAEMQSALINLCVNARDAMPEGGTLTIRTLVTSGCRDDLPKATDDRCAVIEVTDTGTGIPEDLQDRVFDPFFTTKEVGKGTGLGLAAVYGTVKEHGGTIRLSSRLGEGTTFRIALPLESTSPAREAPPADAVEPPRVLEGRRLLLAEDESMLRRLLTDQLAELGVKVVAVEDGRQALAVLEADGNGSIDLLLTDLSMPKMGALDLIRALRASREAEGRAQDVPAIVVMSGNVPEETRERLLAAGVDGILTKPIGFANLGRQLAAVLESHGKQG